PDAQGNIPLSQYTPDLRPPNAIYTTQEHVQELVETVKKQTLPPGTHPEIDMSPAGHKVEVGQKTFSKLAISVGGLANFSLARPGAMLTIPAAVATPIALVAGGLGVYAGLEQAKNSLNLKGYYEGLEKEGVQVLPMQVPVRTKEGTQVQQVEVPIKQVISSAKDQAVLGGAQAVGGALMIASGCAALAALPAAPMLAVGSIVVSIAAPLYAARGQFVMLGKAVWEKIKDKLHIGGKESKSDEPAAPGAQAPAIEAAKTPAAPPVPSVATPPVPGAEKPKTS
ncbi:MAG: hypothetical protein EB084_26500, partial [Proteobacteria bacterium]|nr:hypothetical protein [Pseudomonadota bacterium]